MIEAGFSGVGAGFGVDLRLGGSDASIERLVSWFEMSSSSSDSSGRNNGASLALPLLTVGAGVEVSTLRKNMSFRTDKEAKESLLYASELVQILFCSF
jgi:hypothetical protein